MEVGQHRLEALAEEGVIVGDDDPQRHRRHASGSSISTCPPSCGPPLNRTTPPSSAAREAMDHGGAAPVGNPIPSSSIVIRTFPTLASTLIAAESARAWRATLRAPSNMT